MPSRAPLYPPAVGSQEHRAVHRPPRRRGRARSAGGMAAAGGDGARARVGGRGGPGGAVEVGRAVVEEEGELVVVVAVQHTLPSRPLPRFITW